MKSGRGARSEGGEEVRLHPILSYTEHEKTANPWVSFTMYLVLKNIFDNCK
jgi:hypothetical protein